MSKGTQRRRDSNCWMCGPSEDELLRSSDWRVVLNWNQDRLGKVMIALLRHEEDVTNLSDDEVLSLWKQVRRVTGVLRELFEPDQFNYSFLMNLDPHAHFHVIPRYRGPREFLGETFVDEAGGGERRLSEAQHLAMASRLRSALEAE